MVELHFQACSVKNGLLIATESRGASMGLLARQILNGKRVERVRRLQWLRRQAWTRGHRRVFCASFCRSPGVTGA